MSEGPLHPGEFDDVDELYRRVSGQDKSGPGESVRRAVLEHAARLAAERARNTVVNISAARRRAPRPTWWRPAVFSTLAAASLAGLLIAPQFLPPRQSKRSESAPASVAQPSPSPPAAPDYRGAPQPGAPALNEVPTATANANRVAGSMARNAPAAEGYLAKRQMAPAAPSKPAAQDELQAQSAAADAKVAGNAQIYAGAQGAGADSAEVVGAPLVDPAVELRHAAGSGDMPGLRAALDRHPVIDARDTEGRTALMLASLHGRGGAVDALLAAGADPNAADAHGVTPLQAALDGGQADIAAALRRAGAR
jgi:hypothetical protein